MNGSFDALEEFAHVAKLRADLEKLDRDFETTTRKLFRLASGRKWLRMAMARYNYNGSVFDAADGMDPVKAAVREGRRALLSDILNAAFSTASTTETEDDDD
jgi:hypothetical protein